MLPQLDVNSGSHSQPYNEYDLKYFYTPAKLAKLYIDSAGFQERFKNHTLTHQYELNLCDFLAYTLDKCCTCRILDSILHVVCYQLSKLRLLHLNLCLERLGHPEGPNSLPGWGDFQKSQTYADMKQKI